MINRIFIGNNRIVLEWKMSKYEFLGEVRGKINI